MKKLSEVLMVESRTAMRHHVVRWYMGLLLPVILLMGAAHAQMANEVRAPLLTVHAAASIPIKGWQPVVSGAVPGRLYVNPQAFLDARDIAGAVVRTDILGRALVVLDIKPASGVKLMAATARQENTHLVFMQDGEPVATVPAKGPMTGSRLAIEDVGSASQAAHLAAIFNAGVK